MAEIQVKTKIYYFNSYFFTFVVWLWIKLGLGFPDFVRKIKIFKITFNGKEEIFLAEQFYESSGYYDLKK